jgi:hypothetical protein
VTAKEPPKAGPSGNRARARPGIAQQDEGSSFAAVHRPSIFPLRETKIPIADPVQFMLHKQLSRNSGIYRDRNLKIRHNSEIRCRKLWEFCEEPTSLGSKRFSRKERVPVTGM